MVFPSDRTTRSSAPIRYRESPPTSSCRNRYGRNSKPCTANGCRYSIRYQIAARKTHQGPTVEINFAGDWANITRKDVRRNTAKFSRAPEAAELLFYLQQLNKQYDLQDYDLLITGEGIEQIRKILKGYYRKTLVDKELRSSLPKALRNEEINHNNLIYCFDADR